jgi:hypothetical protein
MHWLQLAAVLLQSGLIFALAWHRGRTEKQAQAALELAARFGEERDELAYWLSFQGWQVDLEDGVRIWWTDGDPEEERLAR